MLVTHPTKSLNPSASIGQIHAVDDYVYPVHVLDSLKFLRNIFIAFFRFNDVLDAQKLHDAIAKLLTIGDWKKLAGRFRSKVRGNTR